MKFGLFLALFVLSAAPISFADKAVLSESLPEMRTMDLDEYSPSQKPKIVEKEKGGWKNSRRGTLQAATEPDVEPVKD